jgi:mannan endo-1,4-beta-mannosidase
LLLAALAVMGGACAPAPPLGTEGGFAVRAGRLVDANGNDFVMRGVNFPLAWFPDRTDAFGSIKALGANAVRVVLGSGRRWGPSTPGQVAAAVALCKQHRLVCVLEVHDTTGFGEEAEAATLDEAAEYWIDVRDALAGEEEYVLVNIGNEPFGNTPDAGSRWAVDTAGVIRRLRAEGFAHALVVDAPNWGQDWQFTMRDRAADVFAGDRLANTVFSVHMYGVFDRRRLVDGYLEAFVRARLPIIIGEFGHFHSDGDPDEDAIMAAADRLGIGYLGWSWSGNSGGVEYLDIVDDFSADRLTPWGERLFRGPNGIAQSAREASVYGGSGRTAPR